MPTEYDHTSLHHRKLLAQHILRVVLDAGFAEAAVEGRGIKERVFYRVVDQIPGVRVQVYTSIEGFGDAAAVREVGEDAIRVCAVYRDGEKSDHGLVSATRIHRTGTIEAIRERLYVRMREAYGGALKVPRCDRCGAPTFLSKKKNRVCAELCWTRRTAGSGDAAKPVQ